MHSHEAGNLLRLQRDRQSIAYYENPSPRTRAVVACLHGLASNASRWYEYLRDSRLRDSCRLLAMDLRGHGRSMTYRRYSRSDWCADLDLMLAQYPEPAFLIGHSMGAQIALDYAASKSHALAGMILIDPIFPQALTGRLRKVARYRLVIILLTALLRLAGRVGLGKRAYPYRDLHQLDLDTRAILAANPDKGIADLYMDPFADLEYLPLLNYLQDLYEVTRPLPSLSNTHAPVLVLLSAGASTSHTETNRRILSTLPECEIREIDADHWLLTERPQQARDVMDEWISARLPGL